MVNNQVGGNTRQTSSKNRKKGNMNVDYVPPQKKYAPSPKPDTGEYIDYEEIK